ncbi:hypothetical protein V8D89_000344 [Ganoderma adspersum]
MAVQLCEAHLVREQRAAVRGAAGLHGSAPALRGHHQISWEDVSSRTFSRVQEIFEEHQPCTLHIVKRLATPAPRKDHSGDVIQRKKRPPTVVATEVVSILDFSHTMFARLLPAAQSILWFGCKVDRPVFNFTSRVGITNSWGTTYNLLARMADESAKKLEEIGRNWVLWLICRGDNSQRAHKQRELRIGRESAMKIGFAVTAADVIDFDLWAADLDDHLHRVAQNLRAQLTTDSLRELVDFSHIEIALELQWLQVLTNYVPALAHCRLMQFHPDAFKRFDIVYPFLETWHAQWTYLSLIYETHYGSMVPLTDDPSRLGHSAAKIGQKPPAKMSKVDYYPALYGAYTVLDARILDCWRLKLAGQGDDLFEYFEKLPENDIPSLQTLRQCAHELHNKYSTQHAWVLAMQGGTAAEGAGWVAGDQWEPSAPTSILTECEEPDSVREDLPEGSEPVSAGPEAEESKESGGHEERAGENANLSGSEVSSESSSKLESSVESERSTFEGDQCLAQSILFMRDTMVSRDASHAVASGDVGRLWDDLKMMTFNFAGSTHSKYTTYLLEMICILELESSPALREVFLRNWLVNPSGEPGRTMEGDLYQEHLNRELEEAIGRGDIESLLREAEAEEDDDDDDLEDVEDYGGPTRGVVELTEDGDMMITLAERENRSASDWILIGEAENNETDNLYDESMVVEDDIDDFEYV